MSSLPLHEDCHFDAHGNSIWTRLLEAEQEALAKLTSDQHQCASSLTAIRVLGFLLKDLWDNARRWNLGDTAYTHLFKKINDICSGEKGRQFDDLVDLGLVYRNHLFDMYESNAEAESTPSCDDSPSSDLCDVMWEWITQGMKYETPTKQNIGLQALLRDGFRCVVCGIADMDTSCMGCDETKGEPVFETKVTHLFTERSRLGSRGYFSSGFDMLTLFGLERKAEFSPGCAVNSLYNVITLQTTLHWLFDTFRLWLEPVEGQEHVYDVHCTVRRLFIPLPPRITLRVNPSAEAKAAEKNVTLSLPDPQMMAIRAICTRVANMSGATEQLRQTLAHLENSTGLAHDGSTTALLAARLSMIPA